MRFYFINESSSQISSGDSASGFGTLEVFLAVCGQIHDPYQADHKTGQEPDFKEQCADGQQDG